MLNNDGREKLWGWFSLSYASWLTLPRVLMHEMPDEWQNKMAELLEDWDNTWDDFLPGVECKVVAEIDGHDVEMPSFLINYRHPAKEEIDQFKKHHANGVS